jgi:uncharacterized peroxidase-related enzyme
MPRLPVVDPATATGPVKEIFDGPLKGKHLNIFRGMANSPAALQLYLNISGALSKSSLSPKEQEVIHLVVSQANGCDYCLAAHTAIGKGHGMSEAQTIAARNGHIEDDAKLGALAKFASALHEKKGHVSDSDLQAFKAAGYTDGAIADVVGTYALAIYTNYFNHVNDTTLDFPPAPAL